MRMTRISVIIPTFNSEKYIVPCVEAIKAQGRKDIEIIIVDNGSKDNTLALIAQHCSEAVLIKNNYNFGACKARNQGIEIASGDWVLSLDCDCVLSSDFFSAFDTLCPDLSADIGLVQPKILQQDRKKIYSAGISLSFLRRFYDIGYDRLDCAEFQIPRNVFGACSAASLLRRRMLNEIVGDFGYFDESFFFLVEDVDLSWRAGKKGWKTLFRPELICYHYGNSSGHDKKTRQYLNFRNRFYSIKKNEGIWKYALKAIPLLCYDFPRIVYLLLTNPYMLKGKAKLLQEGLS
jgi:GT2 family glycosyltransferase